MKAPARRPPDQDTIVLFTTIAGKATSKTERTKA